MSKALENIQTFHRDHLIQLYNNNIRLVIKFGAVYIFNIKPKGYLFRPTRIRRIIEIKNKGVTSILDHYTY